MRSTMRLSGR